jgi:hypothetical protein
MMCFKDKTFCGSPTCKNKCGRKMTKEEREHLSKSDLLVSFALFCDKDGELINYEEPDK